MSEATLKKTTLRSAELNCPSCVAKIEGELRRVAGVAEAEVRFSTGRIVVRHDPRRASTDDLVRAVGKAGYAAKATAF